MNVVDVLVTIIVVTILVTIVLGVVTYIAYKLRLARRPRGDAEQVPSPRYFELHAPAGVAEGSAGGVEGPPGGVEGPAGVQGRAEAEGDA